VRPRAGIQLALLLFCFVNALAYAQAPQAEPEATPKLEISLLTIGPGPIFWSASAITRS